MRRFLVLALFLNASLLALRAWQELPVAHGGLLASGNGDTNGDQAIDLSDAVYLLTWLFQDGPAPVPCPREGGVSGLPDSGETLCYDRRGNVVPCDGDGALCRGQDALYPTGCSSEGRFVENGDGTLTDTCTGLVWLEETADVNLDGRIDSADAIPWCDALDYCENLTYAGHDDWRLPNVRELQGIVDYGRFGPATDPVLGAASSTYWSSTTCARFPIFAWRVIFSDGDVVVGGKSDDETYYVRAVRGGP